MQKFRTGEGKLEPAQIREVEEILARGDGPIQPAEISGQTELSDRKVAAVLHRLEDVGAVEVLPGGQVQLSANADLPEAANAAAQEQKRHQKIRREKLQQMQEYADSTLCRRQMLLMYFGDLFEGPCHRCDNCEEKTGVPGYDSAAGTRREVA